MLGRDDSERSRLLVTCQTFGRKSCRHALLSTSQSVAPLITDDDRDALARATVAYVWEKSAFYRARLQAEGVQPGDISGVDDLQRVPIRLRKDDERELQASRAELGHPFGEHLCVDPAEVVAVASTSGTTGTPTFYAFTAEDVAVTDERWGRASQAGVGPGSVVLQGFGLSMFLAGYPLLRAVERMGVRSFRSALRPVPSVC